MKMGAAIRAMGAAVALWLMAGCATTPVKVKPPAPAEAKQVDAILDRWVESLGGVAVLEKLQGLEVRAVVDVVGGAKFNLHTWQTKENFYRSELLFANGATLIEAYDGKLAWRQSSAFGFGFVPAEELETTLRRNSIRAALNVRNDYPDRRLLPDRDVGGRLCHGVSLTARTGGPDRMFFDAENGRLVRVERWPAGGAAPTEVLEFSDYQEMGGLMLSNVTKVESPDGMYTLRRLETVVNPLVGSTLWTALAEPLREGLRVARILDRYVESVGGSAPLARIRTRVTEQEIEVPANGVKYRATQSQKLPNLMLVEQNLPGLGRMTQGFDGTTGWSNSEVQGYRVLKGLELRQFTENADLRSAARLPERCPLRRWLGPREVEGKPAVALLLATMQGPAGTFYFSESDGHLLRVESGVSAGQEGALSVVFDFSDFRAVDGVVMPFTIKATNPAISTVTKVIAVKHNVSLDDALFKPRMD